MKDKKGFTLIEITAVVLILGAIFLITYPTLENILKKSEEEESNIDKESMEMAVKTYTNVHSYDLTTNNQVKIKIEDLKKDGLIDIETDEYVYVSCEYSNGNFECILEKE